MPSITEVLDYFTEPELLAGMLREGKAKWERKSAEAMRIGKVVDQLIQQDSRSLQQSGGGILPTIDDEAIRNCWQAWQRFKGEHPNFIGTITGIQTELTDGELVGHPDFEITESNRWGIVDVKTSKAIWPKHWTQVAAYASLRHYASNPQECFVGILRLDKATGRYEYQELISQEVIEYEIKIFQAYYTAYQHGQKIREVLRRQLEEEILNVS